MKRLVLLICTILLIILLFYPMYRVISFTEMRTNEPNFYYIVVGKEKRFDIRFTHSIHLTDVLESYEITNGTQIRLVSMEYEDVAVGMPAYAEKDQLLTYSDGKYKLEYKDKVLNNFTLYIGDINYDLFLNYQEEEYNLKKWLNRGNSYLLEVKNISLYDKLKGESIANDIR